MSEADIEWAERLCETQTVTGVEEHDDYLNTCLEENGLTLPNNWQEAIELYFQLLYIDSE